MTLFVTAVDIVTLPRNVWSGLRDNSDPITAAVSALFITQTIIGVLSKILVELVSKSRAGRKV